MLLLELVMPLALVILIPQSDISSFIHSCNRTLHATVTPLSQAPPTLMRVLCVLILLLLISSFYYLFLVFRHYLYFIFSPLKSSVLIICSPFLFGRVLRPYFASLWPDPNCAAWGALERRAAYRYTCSTCADAGASTSDGTSTCNTSTCTSTSTSTKY